MIKTQLIKSLTLTAMISLPNLAYAETFWVTGNVIRTMIETQRLGNCMIQLSSAIGNGCTGNWVSLDCVGKYTNAGNGDRMLNIALLGQNLNKTVSVEIDSDKTFEYGYCTAKRIDLLQ